MKTVTKVKAAVFVVMLLAVVIALTSERPQALAKVQNVVNVSEHTLQWIAFGLAMAGWAGALWMVTDGIRQSRRKTK